MALDADISKRVQSFISACALCWLTAAGVSCTFLGVAEEPKILMHAFDYPSPHTSIIYSSIVLFWVVV